MSEISRDMASEYERIQKRAAEDPGTAGDQGEENWATLLRDWLPAKYEIITKGRIISHEGKTSPQIDILVLKESYPRKLLDKKMYLAAGVAAAFECKVTLKASHIKEAFEKCVKIKDLFEIRTGTPYKELHSPIVYGLLAHSHSWKSINSTPVENIYSTINMADQLHVSHPRQLLDILCVADLATWFPIIATFIGPANVSDWSGRPPAFEPRPNGSATTVYMGHEPNNENQVEYFTPIGGLISHLSQKLAWENPEYRSLADYYRVTNISGSGQGSIRTWETDIYSDKIRPRVQRGELIYGHSWDEWSSIFP